MPVRVSCPSCQAVASVEEQSLGRRGRCRKCGHVFALARPGGDAASAASGDASAWKGSRPAGPTNLPEQFGRYRILKPLGQGGMGAVYLAHDTRLDRRVALKVPFFHPSDGPQAVARFEREARAAATLDHPNLCPIFDVGEVDGTPYLTMPYIEGQPLSEAIPRGQQVPEAQAAALVRKLALALAEAHEKGVVHRDLKPGNIMVNRRRVPIIMDFGLARMVGGDDAPLTRTGHVLGTALYMAPEQAAGDITAAGPACDVYSLGVILYELLTGHRPFEGPWSLVIGLKNVQDPEPPSKHRPGLSPELDAICQKAISRRPGDRHPSMVALAEVLNAFLTIETGRAPVGSPTGQPETIRSPDSLAAQVFTGIITAEVTSLREEPPPVSPKQASAESVPPRPPGRPKVQLAGAAVVLLAVGYFAAPKGGPVAIAPKPGPAITSKRVVPSPINTLGMKLVRIPAGEFWMGSSDSDPDAKGDEKPRHKVRITRAFDLGTTEVTVGQFRQFVDGANYRTEAERDGQGGFYFEARDGLVIHGKNYTWRSTGFEQDDDHPVVNVSWNDANAFCDWLGRVERCRYRLPTEAEWEYACRAGGTTRYSNGDDAVDLAEVGNIGDLSFKERFRNWSGATHAARDGSIFTSPVARYRPNPFGLFDMHGNVEEWCSDGFRNNYYGESPPDDPRGIPTSARRVIRGGGWYDGPIYCRSAFRYLHLPEDRSDSLGFRVVRVPASP